MKILCEKNLEASTNYIHNEGGVGGNGGSDCACCGDQRKTPGGWEMGTVNKTVILGAGGGSVISDVNLA